MKTIISPSDISTENDFVNLLSVSEDKVTSLVNNRLSTSIKENKYDFTIIPREAFSRLENETSITKSKKYLSPYEEGTISVFAHIEAIFSELEANEIAIENPEKVRKYLSLHNDLIEVLKEICLYIFENFENVKSQKIDFFQDVVRTDGYLTLTVVESNFSNKYVKSVLNMYQYFSPYLGKSSGWIQIERDYSIKE